MSTEQDQGREGEAWQYNEGFRVWLYGTEYVGAGVVLDRDGEWHANIVFGAGSGMDTIGPYPTRQEAMRAAEEELARLNDLQQVENGEG